jgi:hypothetical protein
LARARTVLRRGTLLASLISFGVSCGDDAAQSSPGDMNTAGTQNQPEGQAVPFGEYCPYVSPGFPRPVCDSGNGVCTFVGSYELCTHACESQPNCPYGYRCTDTGQGRACLPRCNTGTDCPGMDQATCAAAGSDGDRVCWFGLDSTGEIQLEKKPVLGGVGWPSCFDCGNVEISQNWRFLPGTTVLMVVAIHNAGSGRMAGEITLESQSPYLAVAWAQTVAAIPSTYVMVPHDYPGSIRDGIALGTGGAIQAEVSPDAPLDQPLPFRIVLDEYSGESFVIQFAPRPLPPVVDFALAAPALTSDGDPTGLSLFVANVGDGATSGLVATSLTMPDATNVYVNPELGGGTGSIAAAEMDTAPRLQIGTADVAFGLFPNPFVSVALHDGNGRTWTVSGTITKPSASQ